ncbi:nickel pincer cofactor biosynthesis protein LarB [Sediminispirochaeta bajacaliforniensis]|uniref:nickel pincer cofactor biosynthesis protein LarB n=1 Tax=Sediminispirochaeta bajacaliforniensis TaxID=148 RepID=UPI000370A865|nr:nickel pincer cofactor biosynthesis protein LarB [Sediminispirochaeta bajacaliforniensis]
MTERERETSTETILRSVQEGKLSVPKAARLLSGGVTTDLGFAVIDADRSQRTGYPEVVYCKGKRVEQAEAIMVGMRDAGLPVLGTRASRELAERIGNRFPEAVYEEEGATLTIGSLIDPDEREGLVAVVAAGTSDRPVACEALRTAEFFGSRTLFINDVGVAGIHRLFARIEEIRQARVVVTVAGMEGALASVVAGLVAVPVIAVPTSVGYGASFGGLSALLGMLSACAPGISVVNIDNGFGAGYQANLINRQKVKHG